MIHTYPFIYGGNTFSGNWSKGLLLLFLWWRNELIILHSSRCWIRQGFKNTCSVLLKCPTNPSEMGKQQKLQGNMTWRMSAPKLIYSLIIFSKQRLHWRKILEKIFLFPDTPNFRFFTQLSQTPKNLL